MSEVLIQESLAKALGTGHVPEIHHSDHGSQYGAPCDAIAKAQMVDTARLFHYWARR